MVQCACKLGSSNIFSRAMLRVRCMEPTSMVRMGVRLVGRWCPGPPPGASGSAIASQGAGEVLAAHACPGASGSLCSWWVLARERQVCDRSISGHQNRSMFKATASTAVSTDVPCAKEGARELQAPPLPRLGAAPLCSWPGAFLSRLDLKLPTGGALHPYSFPLPINQATVQHPSPREITAASERPAPASETLCH